MEIKKMITSHNRKSPPRIVIHGPSGIGKSTLGATAPNPLFIPAEDGLTAIDVPAFPVPRALTDVKDYLDAVAIEPSPEYKTLIIDTIDSLEKLIWKQICVDKGVSSIDEIGYGRGYSFALGYWDKIIEVLEHIRSKGLAIILLAHDEIKTYNPPDYEAYDRYQIKLHRTASARVEEWADAILFASFKIYVSADKKAIGGERVLYTSPNPAYVAKNRYSLPDTLPMDMQKILSAISKNK